MRDPWLRAPGQGPHNAPWQDGEEAGVCTARTAHRNVSSWLGGSPTAYGFIEMLEQSRSVKVTDCEAWRGSKLRAQDQNQGAVEMMKRMSLPPQATVGSDIMRPARHDSLAN